MPRRKKSADYDKVITEVYSRLKRRYGSADAYQFEKRLMEEVARDLVNAKEISPIKNIPDIKYTYDARKDFPAAVADDGFWAITGRGKGKYTFERIPQNNLIRIPKDLERFNITTANLDDKTPAAVASVLGNDEQATMTRLRYNDILSSFFGFKTFQVQGHERTNLSCGQIEVDEVYVGVDGNRQFVIPIEGKGGDKDCLSFTQALNLSIYAAEKERYKGFVGRPLGVVRHEGGKIYIVEFSCALKIQELKILQVKTYNLQ